MTDANGIQAMIFETVRTAVSLVYQYIETLTGRTFWFSALCKSFVYSQQEVRLYIQMYI